jgi:UDP-2-acetamido-2-deoxy-ribo-hexuluronate aminotransferase
MKFCDLNRQYDLYKEEIRAAMDEVLESASFINGPAVDALAEELSAYAGVKYSFPCASGTDALLLALMALEVKPGDEVLVPAFTFIATGSMVAHWGAIPVFVDVDPVTFNIDPDQARKKITGKTVGIIPVSLYGQCPDMDELDKLASEYGLWVMEDGAQSFGAEYNGNKSCSLSTISTTSFFPAKPLGCYGDGGAVFTNDEGLAEKVRLFANHGQEKRYHHKYVGLNGRMDTLQAAVVRVKLKHFEQEILERNRVAASYTRHLSGTVDTPRVLEHNRSTWAQYTIRSESRDEIQKILTVKDIPTAIHYPMPLPRQEAFAYLNQPKDFPVSDNLAATVLSLPMHPFLIEEEIQAVADAVKEALRG